LLRSARNDIKLLMSLREHSPKQSREDNVLSSAKGGKHTFSKMLSSRKSRSRGINPK
jgi:hypothetical protein